MRGFALLLILVVILVGMIALGGLHITPLGRTIINIDGLIEDWHYVLSAEPGEVLYVATFDGFLEDWDIYDDGRLSAQVEEGRMRIAAETAGSLPFSVTRQFFGDFDLQVEARAVGGPLDNGFGVVFRLQGADNLYQFLISSDGFYRVVRKAEGIEKILSNWIPSPLIKQGIGERNALRVVATGDRFQFFINGEVVPLCIPNNPDGISTYFGDECIDGSMENTLIDDSLVDGRLGLIVTSLDEPNVEVEFDNLLIVGPGVIE